MAEEQKRKATEEQRYPVYAGVQGIRNNPINSDYALFSDNRTPRGCYIRGNPNHYQRAHPANSVADEADTLIVSISTTLVALSRRTWLR